MINIKPPVWGAILGGMLGVFWLVFGWYFLWITAFIAGGALLGWIFSYRNNFGEKFREVLKVMRGE